MFAKKLLITGGAVLCAVWVPGQASAKAPEQTVQIMAETQDLSDGFGSLNTVTIEYKFDAGDTTVVASPAVGERKAGGVKRTALGGGIDVYHRFSDDISTRTHFAVSEDEPVFARYDVAQDLSFAVAPRTIATIGGRWARYFGKRDVYFVSAGARYYFDGGSVSYRLSYVDPEGRDGFTSHLTNLTINDGQGMGKTQLWLSYGGASIDRTQIEDNFSGDDYGAFLKRIQPLTDNFGLVGEVGVSSYDRPGSRVTGTTVGLGLQVGLNK